MCSPIKVTPTQKQQIEKILLRLIDDARCKTEEALAVDYISKLGAYAFEVGYLKGSIKSFVEHSLVEVCLHEVGQ